MYPQEIVMPMKAQLTEQGFIDLSDASTVQPFIKQAGTTLIVVNSVCGCAAGSARPAVLASLNSTKKPLYLGTVFAGFDLESTEIARQLMLPFPPSSPCIALFKDGELVHMIERHHIESNSAEAIASNLQAAYEAYC